MQPSAQHRDILSGADADIERNAQDAVWLERPARPPQAGCPERPGIVPLSNERRNGEVPKCRIREPLVHPDRSVQPQLRHPEEPVVRFPADIHEMNLPYPPREHVRKSVGNMCKHHHLRVGIENAESTETKQKMDVLPIPS